jgi:hypothetical protein
MQADSRIALPEWPERLRQQPKVRRDRQADRHQAARIVAQLFELVASASHVVENGGRPPDKGLAERRGDHAFRPPFEQRRAKLAFELGDAARQGRLRQAEMAGGGPRLPRSAIAATFRNCVSFMPTNLSISKCYRQDENDIWLRSPCPAVVRHDHPAELLP